jgi:hypothetical protein
MRNAHSAIQRLTCEAPDEHSRDPRIALRRAELHTKDVVEKAHEEQHDAQHEVDRSAHHTASGLAVLPRHPLVRHVLHLALTERPVEITQQQQQQDRSTPHNASTLHKQQERT